MYSFRNVGALALALSNADERAEEGAEGGAEGGATAAFSAPPRGLDLSLAGELENHGALRRLTMLVHRGDRPVGSAEDMGSRRVTSTCSTKRSRG
jgi:hypothetical protein